MSFTQREFLYKQKIPGLYFSNLGAKEILEEEERGQGAMPLEVGGALRLRLEARISRQLAADSRQHKDGGQRAEEMLSVVRGPL